MSLLEYDIRRKKHINKITILLEFKIGNIKDYKVEGI